MSDSTRLITGALHKLGLGSDHDVRGIAQLTGGVSSDIWRIDLADHSICAKRALSRLKVSAVWEAPLSRNSYEYAWYQTVAPFLPGMTPRMLGRDAEAGIFFMEFLEPARYPAIIGSGLRSVCSTTGVPMNVAPVVPLSFTVR